MKIRASLSILSILALLAALACASTKVTDRDEYQGAKLPRPGRIIVYDFAATPADLPDWAEERDRFAASARQTEEELELGRALGAEVAKELVKRIADLGLPAVRAAGQPSPRKDDIVLIGAFTSADEGSTLKRVVIGFGSGSAELKTHVAGYRMTEGGLHKLGSGSVQSGGGGSPGAAVPVLVTVATANPVGLVVGSAVKVTSELRGSNKIQAAAKRTADKIADELEIKFEEQDWI